MRIELYMIEKGVTCWRNVRGLNEQRCRDWGQGHFTWRLRALTANFGTGEINEKKQISLAG